MNGSPKSERFAFSFSIRAKLILINLTLLVSVGLYAYYEQVSFNSFESLEHAAMIIYKAPSICLCYVVTKRIFLRVKI